MKAPAYFLALSTLLCISFLISSSAKANTDLLKNGGDSFSLERWTINNNLGSIILQDGILIASSSQGNISYPFAYLTDFEIPEKFSIDFTFKMTGDVNQGSGIVLSDTYTPPSPQIYPGSNRIFQFWPSGNNVAGIYSDLCLTSQTKCIDMNEMKIISFNSSNWIKIAIKFDGSKYSLYLNDELIFVSSDTSKRLKNIWLGNKQIMIYPAKWTTISIKDFIFKKENQAKLFKTIIIPGFGASCRLLQQFC